MGEVVIGYELEVVVVIVVGDKVVVVSGYGARLEAVDVADMG